MRAIAGLSLSLLFCLGIRLENFNVNRYARIVVAAGDSRLIYVLDLAEIPSFESAGIAWRILRMFLAEL